jgi:hypothetical protein
LLARAIGDFLGAHGYPGAIHSQIHRRSHFAHPFDVLAFIHGDLRAQRFSSSFDLLRAHFYSCQLAQ